MAGHGLALVHPRGQVATEGLAPLLLVANEFLGGCGAFLTGYSDLCSRHIPAAPVSTTRLDDLVAVARQFAEDVARVVADARTGIPAAFESEDFQSQRESITEEFKESQEEAFKGIEEEAQQREIGVIQTPTGIAFIPVREDEALGTEEFKKLPEEEQQKFHDDIARLTKRLQQVMRATPKRAREMRKRVRQLERDVASMAVTGLFDDLLQRFADADRVPDLPDLAARMYAIHAAIHRKMQRQGYPVDRLVDRPPIAHLWTAWRCR